MMGSFHLQHLDRSFDDQRSGFLFVIKFVLFMDSDLNRAKSSRLGRTSVLSVLNATQSSTTACHQLFETDFGHLASGRAKIPSLHLQTNKQP
jgi:hypothetical protein